jgi:molybdate transport system ATP-binding protein
MSATDIISCRFAGKLGGFSLDAAFDTPAQGVTALFGPSGCGKTSVLRCMAGLQRVESGYCRVGDDIWQDDSSFLPTWKRPVGYVFQEASLFPHLSVRENMLYGAPRNGGRMVHFDEVTELLGVARLIDRMPRHLSGGERQRVAIGRALLSEPRLLLMDEPLAALDRETKDQILPFLDRLHDRLSMPIIYVSHDIMEVERFADRIVLMRQGRVIADGSLTDVMSNPDLPLARAREASVVLDAEVTGYDAAYGLARLQVPGGEMVAPSPPLKPHLHRRIRIGAGDVSLSLEHAQQTTILNILPARITSATQLPTGDMLAVLRLGADGEGVALLARVTRRSWETLHLREGLRVFAQVKGVSMALK